MLRILSTVLCCVSGPGQAQGGCGPGADAVLDDCVGVCKDFSQSASLALGDSGLGDSVLPECPRSIFLAHAHRYEVSKKINIDGREVDGYQGSE